MFHQDIAIRELYYEKILSFKIDTLFQGSVHQNYKKTYKWDLDVQIVLVCQGFKNFVAHTALKRDKKLQHKDWKEILPTSTSEAQELMLHILFV